jgi:YHS domain-containing protein
MSLVNGKDTPTDCSINESYRGKTYCFGSQEAHDVFMKSPAENLAKAQKNYETMLMKEHERLNSLRPCYSSPAVSSASARFVGGNPLRTFPRYNS